MKNVKEFSITVEGEQWSKALDEAFNKKKKDVKVDGFRKGLIPKDVYIKKFGIETLYMDAVDLVLNTEYKKLIKDNKLEPVCEPKIDVADINDKSVSFKFTVIEKPEIKLGKYKALGVKHLDVVVSEEDIKKEIETLQSKYADIVEVEEGSVEDGSTAVINFNGIVEGKPLDGGSGENYPLEIGSNTFIPGFESGLIGMQIGEEKVLNLKFPNEYVDNLKGKDVEFTVKVVGIKKRVLPELNEDFYKDLGHDGVKNEVEFKEHMKEHILEHKQSEENNRYVDEVIKAALENLTVEINPEITEDEITRMLSQYREQLKMQGLTLEQYMEFTKSDIDSLKKMMEPEAINRIKVRYLLEEIIKLEGLEITEEELNSEIESMATNYNVSKEEVIKMIGGTDLVKYDLKMRKAIEVLKNN